MLEKGKSDSWWRAKMGKEEKSWRVQLKLLQEIEGNQLELRIGKT